MTFFGPPLPGVLVVVVVVGGGGLGWGCHNETRE